jgi:tRNA pseudouridine55 synthase
VAAYEYPELVLRVECGSGTYIRSLGRDLAESLGTAAVMSALERTAIGCFRIEQAADPRQLTPETCQARLEPLVRAVEMLPKIVLAADEIIRLQHGLTICRNVESPATELAALDASGRLVSIVAPNDGGALRPLRNFPLG